MTGVWTSLITVYKRFWHKQDATGAPALPGGQQAFANGADCIVYPELAAIGYPPRDLLDRWWLVREQWAMVERLAENLPLPALIGCIEPGEPIPGQHILANALVLLCERTGGCSLPQALAAGL